MGKHVQPEDTILPTDFIFTFKEPLRSYPRNVDDERKWRGVPVEEFFDKIPVPIRLGDDTNYLDITDGVLTLGGTARRILTLRADLDYTTITAQGKPTQVAIGVFHGYSMPIYAADNEELFFNENVPGRWDGASDITFMILVALASAETPGETFKFQFSWNQAGATDIVPITSNDVTCEIIVVDGTQYATYYLTFTIDYNADVGDVIATHDDLAGRLRRVASSGDEVDGEIVVLDWHTHYWVDKMFRASI